MDKTLYIRSIYILFFCMLNPLWSSSKVTNWKDQNKFNDLLLHTYRCDKGMDEDRGSILVLGPTRSGKSTIICNLLGVKLKLKQINKPVNRNLVDAYDNFSSDEESEIQSIRPHNLKSYRVVPSEKQSIKYKFPKIGHSHNSETLIPEMYQSPHTPYSYFDSAGLFDARGKSEECFSESFPMLLNNTSKSNLKAIMVVISREILRKDSNHTFRRAAEIIGGYFRNSLRSQERVEKMSKFCILVINKCQEKQDRIKALIEFSKAVDSMVNIIKKDFKDSDTELRCNKQQVFLDLFIQKSIKGTYDFKNGLGKKLFFPIITKSSFSFKEKIERSLHELGGESISRNLWAKLSIKDNLVSYFYHRAEKMIELIRVRSERQKRLNFLNRITCGLLQSKDTQSSKIMLINEKEKINSIIDKKRIKIEKLQNDETPYCVDEDEEWHYNKCINFVIDVFTSKRKILTKAVGTIPAIPALILSPMEEILRPYTHSFICDKKEPISSINISLSNGKMWGKEPKKIYYKNNGGIYIAPPKSSHIDRSFPFEYPSKMKHVIKYRGYKYVANCYAKVQFFSKKKLLSSTQKDIEMEQGYINNYKKDLSNLDKKLQVKDIEIDAKRIRLDIKNRDLLICEMGFHKSNNNKNKKIDEKALYAGLIIHNIARTNLTVKEKFREFMQAKKIHLLILKYVIIRYQKIIDMADTLKLFFVVKDMLPNEYRTSEREKIEKCANNWKEWMERIKLYNILM